MKNLFGTHFLRRRRIFEKKQTKNDVFGLFLEDFDQKTAFFDAHSLRMIIHWRLLKTFRVGQPKIVLKGALVGQGVKLFLTGC